MRIASKIVKSPPEPDELPPVDLMNMDKPRAAHDEDDLVACGVAMLAVLPLVRLIYVGVVGVLILALQDDDDERPASPSSP